MRQFEYNLTDIESFDASNDFRSYTRVKLIYKSSGLKLYLNKVVLEEGETLDLSPIENILTHKKIGKSVFVIKVELS